VAQRLCAARRLVRAALAAVVFAAVAALGVALASARSAPAGARVPAARAPLVAPLQAPGPEPPSAALGWGSNGFGEVGDGTREERLLPVSTSGLTGVTAIAAGANHSLALLGNGTVEAWGNNETGELGNGTSSRESKVPVLVSGLSEVTAIAAGEMDSFALLRNGTVMAWGYDNAGRLGVGQVSENCNPEGPCSRTPLPIKGLTEVTAIAAAEDHAAALLGNGTVMTWGRGQLGELGNGQTEYSPVPVKVSNLTEATAIAAGYNFDLAMLRNGTVMSWGFNVEGELGDGSFTGPETCSGSPCATRPVPVTGLGEVVTLSAGASHSLALLKSGSVKAWGANAAGELGTGNKTRSAVPVAVSGLSEVAALGAGEAFSLALLKNGTAEAWGANSFGQLGTGNTTGSEVPVPVKGLTEATALAAGRYHSMAIGALIPVPAVTQVQPSSGRASGGTTVTVTGTSFSGASEVKFGSANAAHFTVESATQITAVSPPGTGTVDVTVVNSGLSSPTSSADQFDYAPTVAGVVPAYGPAAGSTSVTITGTDFNEVTGVKFGASNATQYKVTSESTITAVTPPGSGVVDVSVQTAGGTSPATSADHFDYGPTLTKVEPAYGPRAGGTSVTLTGTNFTEVTAVRFGAAAAQKFTVNSEGSLTAVSPPGTGTVEVTVTTRGGVSPAASGDAFSYGPTVTGLERNNGLTSGGNLVTITGVNLGGATAVRFGSTETSTFAVNSPTSINAISPPGSGTVDVTVTTAEGTSATGSADQFTYFTQPACQQGHNPVVQSVQPDGGPAGTSVGINGERFFVVLCGSEGFSPRKVVFGAQEASFHQPREGHIVAVAPPGSGVVQIRVERQDGTTTAPFPYTYGAGPAAPQVLTGTATAISSNSATLQAVVNPNGAEVTACQLEYGPTASYGHSAPCSPAPGSGSQSVEVSATVTDVSPLSTYHFRISAGNAGGTSTGADETFTTTAVLGGAFVIGDAHTQPGETVRFWSEYWDLWNQLSGGGWPLDFGGYATTIANNPPHCGDTWTSGLTGLFSKVPASVPEMMYVIVSSSITSTWNWTSPSMYQGNTQKVLLVKTNPGYGGDWSHTGTATVVSQACP